MLAVNFSGSCQKRDSGSLPGRHCRAKGENSRGLNAGLVVNARRQILWTEPCGEKGRFGFIDLSEVQASMQCGACTRVNVCDERFRHKPEKLLKNAVVLDVVDLPRERALVTLGGKSLA